MNWLHKLIRWWRGTPLDEQTRMSVPVNGDLQETRRIIRESSAKLHEADARIADYQRRIREENERRLAMARARRDQE